MQKQQLTHCVSPLVNQLWEQSQGAVRIVHLKYLKQLPPAYGCSAYQDSAVGQIGQEGGGRGGQPYFTFIPHHQQQQSRIELSPRGRQS